MRWLTDSNILLRSVQAAHPMYIDVSRAVSMLFDRGDELADFLLLGIAQILLRALGVHVQQVFRLPTISCV